MPVKSKFPHVVLLISFFMAACSASGGSTAVKPDTGKAELSVQFQIEDGKGKSSIAFSSGDTARFVVRLRNNSGTPMQIAYTWPPQRFRVTEAKTNDIVWEAFSGRMFPQVLRNQEIPSGEAVDFVAEWNLTTTDGKPVPPGTYQVTPAFTAFRQPGNQRMEHALRPIMITVVE